MVINHATSSSCCLYYYNLNIWIKSLLCSLIVSYSLSFHSPFSPSMLSTSATATWHWLFLCEVTPGESGFGFILQDRDRKLINHGFTVPAFFFFFSSFLVIRTHNASIIEHYLALELQDCCSWVLRTRTSSSRQKEVRWGSRILDLEKNKPQKDTRFLLENAPSHRSVVFT